MDIYTTNDIVSISINIKLNIKKRDQYNKLYNIVGDYCIVAMYHVKPTL